MVNVSSFTLDDAVRETSDVGIGSHMTQATHMLSSITAPCEPNAFNKLRHGTGNALAFIVCCAPQSRYVLIFQIKP